MASKFNLEKHLQSAHHQSPVAEFLKEIVYGGIDGIVTTFAVVASFSGAALSGADPATASFITVLLFGLGNLFADGMSMGLGEFLSTRSEQDLVRNQRNSELVEMKENLDQEKLETVSILQDKGFDEKQARELAEIYMSNPNYWADWMLRYEHGIGDPEAENPYLKGSATFISFLIFGFVPLVPFALLVNYSTQSVFLISSISTLLALLTLGAFRWKVTGQGMLRSVGEVVIIGGVAAVVAFIVGTLFG